MNLYDLYAVGTHHYTNFPLENQAPDLIFFGQYLCGEEFYEIADRYNFHPIDVFIRITRAAENYCSFHKKGQHLTFFERRYIELMLLQGKSNYKIAKALNCSQSTIANEIKRFPPTERYEAKKAHHDYKTKKANNAQPIKLESCYQFLKDFTLAHDKYLRSPEAFCMQAKALGLYKPEEMVSYKTIYNYIKKNRLRIKVTDMPKMPCYIENEKKDMFYERPISKHGDGVSIELMPSLFDHLGNKIFGGWQADLVKGKREDDPGAILTLVELKTRFFIAVKLESSTQEVVNEALLSVVNTFGDMKDIVFRTILFDNGTEFMDIHHHSVMKFRSYFAHPGYPTERATNERYNGWLRNWVPKGTAMSTVSSQKVIHIQDCMNTTYKKSLNNNSSINEFARLLSLKPNQLLGVDFSKAQIF